MSQIHEFMLLNSLFLWSSCWWVCVSTHSKFCNWNKCVLLWELLYKICKCCLLYKFMNSRCEDQYPLCVASVLLFECLFHSCRLVAIRKKLSCGLLPQERCGSLKKIIVLLTLVIIYYTQFLIGCARMGGLIFFCLSSMYFKSNLTVYK